MAKDIVCGMEIDERRAAGKREYQGRTYYFCSPGCQQGFEDDPAHEDATHQLTVQPGEGGPCVR